MLVPPAWHHRRCCPSASRALGWACSWCQVWVGRWPALWAPRRTAPGHFTALQPDIREPLPLPPSLRLCIVAPPLATGAHLLVWSAGASRVHVVYLPVGQAQGAGARWWQVLLVCTDRRGRGSVELGRQGAVKVRQGTEQRRRLGCVACALSSESEADVSRLLF